MSPWQRATFERSALPAKIIIRFILCLWINPTTGLNQAGIPLRFRTNADGGNGVLPYLGCKTDWPTEYCKVAGKRSGFALHSLGRLEGRIRARKSTITFSGAAASLFENERPMLCCRRQPIALKGQEITTELGTPPG